MYVRMYIPTALHCHGHHTHVTDLLFVICMKHTQEVLQFTHRKFYSSHTGSSAVHTQEVLQFTQSNEEVVGYNILGVTVNRFWTG